MKVDALKLSGATLSDHPGVPSLSGLVSELYLKKITHVYSTVNCSALIVSKLYVKDISKFTWCSSVGQLCTISN